MSANFWLELTSHVSQVGFGKCRSREGLYDKTCVLNAAGPLTRISLDARSDLSPNFVGGEVTGEESETQ